MILSYKKSTEDLNMGDGKIHFYILHEFVYYRNWKYLHFFFFSCELKAHILSLSKFSSKPQQTLQKQTEEIYWALTLIMHEEMCRIIMSQEISWLQPGMNYNGKTWSKRSASKRKHTHTQIFYRYYRRRREWIWSDMPRLSHCKHYLKWLLCFLVDFPFIFCTKDWW